MIKCSDVGHAFNPEDSTREPRVCLRCREVVEAVEVKRDMPDGILCQKNGEEFEMGYKWQNYPHATPYIRRDIVTPEEINFASEDLQQAEDHWNNGINFVLHATTCMTIRKLLIAHGGQ